MNRDHVDAQQAAFDAHHDDPGDLPVMRARFEYNGSPRFLLYAIKRLDLDHRHGFHLDVQLVTDELESGMETIRHRLDEGDTDLVDTDYISVARERAAGANIVAFHPYGRTVGGLVAPEDTAIEGLADLSGHRLGVTRRLDKNWILTRAACRKFHDFDPAETATLVEADSRDDLTRLIRGGEVDAGFQFWPLVPELTETGRFVEVLPVSDLVQRLAGTDDKLPIATFVTGDSYLDAHPEAVRGFAAAAQDAVDHLLTRDDIWDDISRRLLPDATVASAVTTGWREMVVTEWGAETIAGMRRLFDHLHAVAGADALGVETIPDGTFWLDP
ncbi:ABC transporter substrate-binding protein [Haloplanus aerogenes]|uniref:ABC transporter substrate-binding protein n=1 Tax=Haloplanus aerogenes TaxID=660522 RepID=A0A3M0CZV9_9EURY|nr:ABC transporter substrate-binding protein [Haloplanus aerogenes]AZH26753.1 ABC transporter substrate-binding protein [Haloplanus aerogenes]RMB12999.1 NitT/TauT family transport system substrate-binding protein [Haloplanus aerogenes]